MDGECTQALATFLVTGDVDEQPNPADPAVPDEPKDNTPVANPKVIAVDDAGETKKNTSITLPILKNDAIEKVTSVEIVTQPKNGTVEILPNNTVKYTPKTDYVGNDIFVYNACNAIGCDIATVRVTVKPDGLVMWKLAQL